MYLCGPHTLVYCIPPNTLVRDCSINGRDTATFVLSKELKVRVWKRFKLEDAKEALQALFAKERDGRILLDINNGI